MKKKEQKIPTAYEYLANNLDGLYDLTSKEDHSIVDFYKDVAVECMVGFAEVQVQAAIKAIVEKVRLKDKSIDYGGVRAGCYYVIKVIDEESIKKAYPLDSIKYGRRTGRPKNTKPVKVSHLPGVDNEKVIPCKARVIRQDRSKPNDE